jgi:hypothetical protein
MTEPESPPDYDTLAGVLRDIKDCSDRDELWALVTELHQDTLDQLTRTWARGVWDQDLLHTLTNTPNPPKDSTHSLNFDPKLYTTSLECNHMMATQWVWDPDHGPVEEGIFPPGGRIATWCPSCKLVRLDRDGLKDHKTYWELVGWAASSEIADHLIAWHQTQKEVAT